MTETGMCEPPTFTKKSFFFLLLLFFLNSEQLQRYLNIMASKTRVSHGFISVI